MNSSPENRTKFMRPPPENQRPPTYATPTASQRAIGKCRAVSVSVLLPARKGKTLAKIAPATKGSASQRMPARCSARFHTK